MLKLMLITNDPLLAKFAVRHSVQRIFVDLEIYGKKARQGHRDTLISNHNFDDIRAIRSAIGEGELLARLNPVHGGTELEIETAIEAGADILMLPMFTLLEEVRRFSRAIAGRCRFIPLVETPQALKLVEDLVQESGVDELYIGLNDLHLALEQDFMFQLVADGTVERVANLCRQHGVPFGFGGIARMEEGLLPGKLVLAEHYRLGSTAVILSRTFHRAAISLDEMQRNIDFENEIQALRAKEASLAIRDERQQEQDRQLLVEAVGRVLARIKQGEKT